MANKERGEFTLVAGEARYTLRLTTNACCELEEFSGRLWPQVLEGGQRGSFRDIRLILWAGLREHQPAIATADPAGLIAVGKVIDACGGISGLHMQILTFLLLNADHGEETGGAAKAGARPLAAQAGTGVASTLTHSPSV